MTLAQKKAGIVKRFELMVATVKQDIPEQYHNFLIPLERNIKFKWFGKEEWVNDLTTLYFMVTGRLKMACDEHGDDPFFLTGYGNKSTEPITLTTEIPGWAQPTTNKEVPPLKHTILVPPNSYVAIFASPIRGIFDGCDTLDPDKGRFSLADGETSAVGRALGKAGYGIVSSGFASVEEMVKYLSTGAETAEESATPEAPAKPATGSSATKTPAVPEGTKTEAEPEKKKPHEFNRNQTTAVTGLTKYTQEQLEGLEKNKVAKAVKELSEAMGLNSEHIITIYKGIMNVETIDKRKISKAHHIDAYLSLAKVADWK